MQNNVQGLTPSSSGLSSMQSAAPNINSAQLQALASGTKGLQSLKSAAPSRISGFKGAPTPVSQVKGIGTTSTAPGLRTAVPVTSRVTASNLTSSRIIQKSLKPPQGLFCRYSKRACHLNRLDGYEFCLKHILQDKNAPYRQVIQTLDLRIGF